MKLLARLAAVGFAAFIVAACSAHGLDDLGDPSLDGGRGGDGSGGGDGNNCSSKCNNMCADLKTDPANCGVCGKACPSDATCVQGQCQCPPGDGGASRAICNGQCVDTKSDANNCGGCGLTCGGDGGTLMGGGTWKCTNGTCDIACAMPKSACVPFGCYDLQKDNTNCGVCGTDCSGALCLTGTCCSQGEVDCVGKCTNTQTDAMNCGMCGTKCTSTCTLGKCCSKPPTGNCVHNACVTGNKLGVNCDGVSCVSKVCAKDSFCCAVLWDSICVGEVDTYCGPTYKCSC